MIETKLVEIRDKARFIPAMAIRVRDDGTDEAYLLMRAGWDDHPGVYLIHLVISECHIHPCGWDGPRTMRIAHRWIWDNWDDVMPGMVVDVEFILGKTDGPKESERYEGLQPAAAKGGQDNG